MKTKTINAKYHSKFIVINEMKYVKNHGFLTLAGPIDNTIDKFHTYKQKQTV